MPLFLDYATVNATMLVSTNLFWHC